MSATLRINQVTLQGSGESWSWRFGTGINVLVGPVGVGKTSLLELVKYGLGGRATLTRAIRNVGDRVLVDALLADRRLVLIRGVRQDRQIVQVLEPNQGPLGRFPVAPDGERTTISDFLLEILGIPRLTIPRSQARPTDEYTRISFNDVYSYLYLDQTEIDRSTIHHLDRARDVKRRQTFELLYGLLDSASAQLKVELADATAERERTMNRARIVRDFLTTAGLPSLQEIRQRLDELTAAQVQTQRELEQLAIEARRASSAADRHRGLAQELESRVAAARDDYASTRAEVDGLRSVQAQVRLDHDRTLKAMVAGDVFSAFEFRSCPRCLQSLDRPIDAGACPVCAQTDPPLVDNFALDDERQRLEAQLIETDELLEESTRQLNALETLITTHTAELAATRARIDQLSAAAVAPFADARARQYEELGKLRAEAEALAAQHRLSTEMAALESRVVALSERVAELGDSLDAARAELEAARTRIGELSEIFSEIIVDLQLPWAQSAAIDLDDYLPRIDGDRLELLGSGGIKTIVNVAYFMANLTWSLREPSALLPRLLIIDSPRKDHGAGIEDMRAADRIYAWMLRLQETARSRGAIGTGRPFQLIIADNDVPDHVRQRVRLVELGYDTPLISDANSETDT